jgi:hypothetical protein
MEEVKFIDRPPDCRSCVFEIENASRKRLERIAEERKKHGKCKNCVRLPKKEVK